MGSVIGKAADGIAAVLAAPFKSIFGESCENICSGPWDMFCFIEHLCVSSLVKFLMIIGLCYITLMFFYVLFKIGLCQCIARSLCKMCWLGCETYCYALADCTCFLWHKLLNTRRVHRRRHFRDVENGYTSSFGSSVPGNYRDLSNGRKRKSMHEAERAHLQKTLFSSSKHCSRHQQRHLHRHGRIRSSKFSIRVKGRSKGLRKSRGLQLPRGHQMRPKFFKRRRTR